MSLSYSVELTYLEVADVSNRVGEERVAGNVKRIPRPYSSEVKRK